MARAPGGSITGGNPIDAMNVTLSAATTGAGLASVDVGAIEFIHRRLIAMRDRGKAVLLISVELDEIRSLSDRILVMFDGQVVGEADPATATEGELGLMMAGIGTGPGLTARPAGAVSAEVRT